MTPTHRIFLYGTLLDPELFGIVGNGALTGDHATLEGRAIYWAAGESFPVIVHEAGGLVEGVVIDVTDEMRARLDFYETGFGYDLEPVEVRSGAGRGDALVYVPETGRWPLGDVWSLSDWQDRYGVLTRRAAADYMRLCGERSPREAALSFPQIRARADSRLRAERAPSPDGFGGAPVIAPEVAETRYPYTAYFGVREDDLSVPLFGGGLGPKVTRASWLGADAVTVLPYDPATDRVLVIRQFRHGPFARGDANPWSVEPVAGRIDPGETPEAAAAREMVEEAGVTATEMIRIGAYYPSPGAFSEHLTSFIAVADLIGRDGAIGGVEDEAEDILSYVLPFDDLFGMIENGVVNTGPLILSLQWLALHRAGLQTSD